MKFTVTVDLSDMYTSDFVDISGDGEIREDSNFSDAVKAEIRSSVIRDVLADWGKKGGRQFSEEIHSTVEKMQDGFLSALFMQVAESKEIASPRWGKDGEKVSIIDVIRGKMTEFYCERGVDERLTRIAREQAEKTAKELKDRYDLLFASHLVTKMNENGMLREDVAKTLLEAPKKS